MASVAKLGTHFLVIVDFTIKGYDRVAATRQFNICWNSFVCNRSSRGCTQYKCLTVNRDALTLATCSDKGKPVERRGRKATGLKEVFL